MQLNTLDYIQELPEVRDFHAFISHSFLGKTRRGGVEPYFEHLRRVAEAAANKDLKFSLQLYITGLAHDLVEDTEFTLVNLESYLENIVYNLGYQQNFVGRLNLSDVRVIVDAVDLLTKRKGELSQDNILRIANKANHWIRYNAVARSENKPELVIDYDVAPSLIATIVKYFDTLDNSVMNEEGRKFTIEVLHRDPDMEVKRYLALNEKLKSILQHYPDFNNKVITKEQESNAN
jgi:hypothetical protein